MPATLQGPDEHQSLANTMGSMLIGTIVSCPLYGMSLMQYLHYIQEYPNDGKLSRFIVSLVLVLDTLHFVMITHSVYHYFVLNYYNESALTRVVWSVIVESVPTALTASIVQCFYAHRLYILSERSYLLCGLVILLVIATSGVGVAWLIFSLQAKTFADLLNVSRYTIAINALSMVTDSFIACTLCVILLRKKTGMGRTNSIINQLVIFMISTGLLTSACAIVSLVTLSVLPDTLIYAGFYFCIGRLYTNSILASLNARKILRRRNSLEDFESTSISMPVGFNVHRARSLSIKVETSRDVFTDVSVPSLPDSTGAISAIIHEDLDSSIEISPRKSNSITTAFKSFEA